ncbi:MAG: carbohydrate binding family 9 domain-containing protein [Gemmatimonadota bacterium]|nr:carbohydrate binding family 9 domain-containing protein [Gemmatimonadota bacterium]
MEADRDGGVLIRAVRIFPLLFALTVPAAASAQAGAATPGGDPHANAPAVRALRVSGPIRVDGRLEEAVWATATPVTGFTQLDPEEGKAASERTEVRILYDAEALYVGARLHDRGRVTGRLGRRDMPMAESDWLTVILDSYHDHRTAYGFEVNPSGVRRDQTRSENREDDSWDPVWEAQTSIDSTGWTAELRIPFSQLRFNPAREQTWGIQLERQIARNREFSVFSFTPRSERGGIPRFGHLTGLAGPAVGKRLEVLPYSVARAENVERGANPYRSDREYGASAGLDLKYRVTSNLTLDATVNPDFGQVEVDPAEVNLSAIETRLQEKRPFFVEGSEIFNFGSGGGNSVFYSRRIGRQPQLQPPGPARDVPEATRILGAAKLSGQTGGGWSVGVLEAVTRREEARFRDPRGLDQSLVAEPLSNYFLGRARRQMRAGQSSVGGFLGTVHRELDTDPLRASLRSAAYSGGIDFRHEWDRRLWSLSGFVAASHVRGSPRAMVLTQSLPSRYFQRPDAEHLEVDSAAVSLSGISAEVTLNRQVGRHWRGTLLAGTTSPGYEINDVGFQYRADRVDAAASLTYLETRPGKLLRQYSLSGSARMERSYAGERIMEALFMSSSFQTPGYWDGRLGVNLFHSTLDDRLTRGGPAARRPAAGQLTFRLASDARKPLLGALGGYLSVNDAGGIERSAGMAMRLQPASTWEVTVNPLFYHARFPAQYLRRVDDPTATSTFGARYVFAPLELTTMVFQTRLNYTFSPALSLQVYAQPFLSSADFGDPAELAAPRSFEFLTYGRGVGQVEKAAAGVRVWPAGREGMSFVVPDPDFNLRSLRGNAVLRWEWRPGSTLFLVWQQNRSDLARVGDFDLGRDQAALFAARPDNIFVLKVNYWLNP